MEVNWSGLVEKAKKDDQDAFLALYQNSYDAVYRTVKSMVREEDTVLDIVQDAFVKGFGSLHGLENPALFLPWMKQIATNKARDWFKKRQELSFSQLAEEDGEEPDFEDECIENLPDAVLDREETARLIDEILYTLPEEQRIAIGMRYYRDMSVAEIAQALEVSENTVKSRLNYGRKKIKTSVEALAKQGVKLYSLAPVSFLVWLFRMQAAQTTAGNVPVTVFGNIMAELAVQGTAAAASGAGAAASGAALSGGIAAAGKAGGLLASVGAKIAAGVISVVIIGGGIGAGIYLASRNNGGEPPAVSDTAVPEAEQLIKPTAVPEPGVTSTPEATEVPAATVSATETAAATPTPTPVGNTDAPHEHSYTFSVTKEAACKEEGLAAYKCACGDTYTETIPATGHNWEFDIIHDDGEYRWKYVYMDVIHGYVYVSYKLTEEGIEAGLENDPERPGYITKLIMEYYEDADTSISPEKRKVQFLYLYGRTEDGSVWSSTADRLMSHDFVIAVAMWENALGREYIDTNYEMSTDEAIESVVAGKEQEWINLPSDTPRWTCSHCGKVVLFQNEKPED